MLTQSVHYKVVLAPPALKQRIMEMWASGIFITFYG